MKLTTGEYLFAYKGDDHQEKKALGYANTINGITINERDVTKDPFTATQIIEIAEHLGVHLKDLHVDGVEEANHYEDQELARILSNDPSKIKTPFILSDNHSFFVGSSYELIKEKLEFNGVEDNMANQSER